VRARGYVRVHARVRVRARECDTYIHTCIHAHTYKHTHIQGARVGFAKAAGVAFAAPDRSPGLITSHGRDGVSAAAPGPLPEVLVCACVRACVRACVCVCV